MWSLRKDFGEEERKVKEIMKELIIKNQIEFDNISNDFSGCIYFENGNNLIIVKKFPNARLVARDSG